MKPPLRIYFRDDRGAYFYCDAEGEVGSTDSTEMLPDGTIRAVGGQMLHSASMGEWEKEKIGLARNVNDKYHGVFNVYSPEQLTFYDTPYKDPDGINAYKVLNTYKVQYGGTEALLYIDVYKLDYTDQIYKLYTTATLDFSTATASLYEFTIDIMQGGLAAALAARKDIAFDIPLNVGNTEKVKDDLLTLQGSYSFRQFDSGTDQINLGFASTMTIPVYFLADEGNLGILTQNVNYYRGYPQVSTAFNKRWLVRALATNGVVFNWDLHLTLSRNDFPPGVLPPTPGTLPIQDITPVLKLSVYDADDDSTIVGTYDLYTYPAISPDGSITVENTGNITLSLTEGQYVEVYIDFTPPTPFTSEPPNINMSTVGEPKVYFTYDVVTPSGVIRGLRPLLFWNALQNNVAYPDAGDPPSVISSYLQAEPSTSEELKSNINLIPVRTFLTCSDALRKIYTDADGNPIDPVIKTSINEAQKAFLAAFNTGIGIDVEEEGREVLRVEKLNYFYDPSILIVDLGADVSDVQFAYILPDLYSSLEGGYDKAEYGTLNGRYDAFTKQQWSSQAIRTENKIDLTIPYQSSPHAITYLARNLDGQTSKDDRRDNKTFFLACGATYEEDATTYYYLDRTFTVSNGFPESLRTSMFNLPLTPKSCILRNGNRLRIPAYEVSTKYTSGEGNGELEFTSSESDLRIRENEAFVMGSITIDYPATTLYRGISVKLKSSTPIDLWATMNETVIGEDGLEKKRIYGYVQFTYKGEVIKFHVDKLEQTLAVDGAIYEYTGKLTRDCVPLTVIF